MLGKKTTKQKGDLAEDKAAKFLILNGFKIIERNFRTKLCEIDIVASKGKVVYFIEVKYRQSPLHGDGLDAVTPVKLEQMAFAAEIWVNTNDWSGEYQLAAISTSGSKPKVDQFVMI